MATPPYNTTGVFVLSEPFASNDGFTPGKIYTCDSIEGFESLDIESVDVYEEYYAPFGLSNEAYMLDRINSVNIVTLLDSELIPFYVPSSYIKSFPKTIAIPYNNLFVVFELGVLPDGLNIDAGIAAAKVALDESIGCSSNGEITLIPNVDQVTFSEHQTLEANRKNNINTAANFEKQLAYEKDKNLDLLSKINALEEIIVSLKK